MTIQKNVASQRLHFLMVDATDFATPETGVNTTNQYCKDNGAGPPAQTQSQKSAADFIGSRLLPLKPMRQW